MTTAQSTLLTSTSIVPLLANKSASIDSRKVIRNMKFGTPSLEKVWLPTMSGYVHLLVNEIGYFKADSMIAQLFTSDGQSLYVNESLKFIEQELESRGFVRIHKSYLVNVYNISKYVKRDTAYVIMECGSKVPISRRNKWKLRLGN